jgi:hypothetical protein
MPTPQTRRRQPRQRRQVHRTSHHRRQSPRLRNARKPSFNPEPCTIVRIEDHARIASLVADALATYQPITPRNAPPSTHRPRATLHVSPYTLEAGFFTNCLDTAMAGPEDPYILQCSEIARGIDIHIDQARA